ncbi:MAPEG family protein [Alisedimentitalea sp. MJ-SS2]|uniref:MAPEG family protein n=1 Tax=Aliisedimentitalea sp. MJ-SS2 TaxID=3049795 RepID=UPI0029079B56|nr:MAPEG family protein [Alisedimentitalea sp. MJ-SS2]MDU8926641.1 MAPEG family protein [Alisedimentitalea sp. MJ-SS2]
MTKRHKIVIGMVLAMIWSVVIVWLPQTMKAPFMPLNAVIITALLPGGLVMVLLIGALGFRRFFDASAIDGAPFEVGTGGDIDQRVLINTAEQILLSAVLWPFVALTLGGLVTLWLGVGFAVARLAFWIGYHISPPLRAFGYGATFYPTVLATLWALAVWMF